MVARASARCWAILHGERGALTSDELAEIACLLEDAIADPPSDPDNPPSARSSDRIQYRAFHRLKEMEIGSIWRPTDRPPWAKSSSPASWLLARLILRASAVGAFAWAIHLLRPDLPWGLAIGIAGLISWGILFSESER